MDDEEVCRKVLLDFYDLPLYEMSQVDALDEICRRTPEPREAETEGIVGRCFFKLGIPTSTTSGWPLRERIQVRNPSLPRSPGSPADAAARAAAGAQPHTRGQLGLALPGVRVPARGERRGVGRTLAALHPSQPSVEPCAPDPRFPPFPCCCGGCCRCCCGCPTT